MESKPNMRPSMLLAVPAPLPVASVPPAAAPAFGAVPASAAASVRAACPTPRLTAGEWRLPREHQAQLQAEPVRQAQLQADLVRQAQLQAEPVRALVPAGGYGIGGFADADVVTSKVRIDVRGVPPRGKPV